MSKKIYDQLPLILAIFIFSSFYLLSTSNGMNLTADSKHYIKVAQQIYQNGFISIWKNEDLVYWPPLYPIILSFIQTDINLYVKVFHYLLVIILLRVWHQLSKGYFKSRGSEIIFMVFLSLSTHLTMIAVFIWSELFFLLLLSLVILCLWKMHQSKKIIWLCFSVLPSFLMLIQRNAGIFIIVPLYFSLYLFKLLQLKYIRIVVLCFIASVSGFLFWNIKNIVIESRSYMLSELFPHFSPFENSKLVINELGSIFYPSLVFYPYSIVITIFFYYLVSWRIFRSDTPKFLQVLYLSTLLYLAVWIIIPGDASNMGRFISIIVPIIVLISMYAIIEIIETISVHKYFKYVIIVSLVLYSFVRITNNSLLWGGKKNYVDFSEIHKNVFYKKSGRVIGRPQKE